MLIAEQVTSRPFRKSFGFSLSEAARIRRDILAGNPSLECPRCAGNLEVVGTRGGEDVVWITTCADCRTSLVVHRRAGDLA